MSEGARFPEKFDSDDAEYTDEGYVRREQMIREIEARMEAEDEMRLRRLNKSLDAFYAAIGL